MRRWIGKANFRWVFRFDNADAVIVQLLNVTLGHFANGQNHDRSNAKFAHFSLLLWQRYIRFRGLRCWPNTDTSHTSTLPSQPRYACSRPATPPPAAQSGLSLRRERVDGVD